MSNNEIDIKIEESSEVEVKKYYYKQLISVLCEIINEKQASSASLEEVA